MRTQKTKNTKLALLAAAAGLALVGAAQAATPVSANITTSTTWTKAKSPYYLTRQIYVTNGATLTIEPGTVIASYVDPADGQGVGSLAVCRDGKIRVMGTAAEPVIMTSAQDVATWTGSVVTTNSSGYVTDIVTLGNPKTGTWRQGLNEWGNLTIMGNALIGAQYEANASAVRTYQDGYGAPIVTNTARPTGLNKATMEGLTADAAGDPKVFYGGADDDDDRGEIHYLSIRYGGKVIGLANELNGLSLGGVGRATTIDHVEIMNNVDDGIEIWGGTVNLKYVSVWNVGDDYFDLDQGWRGKAQFGLIVQGFSKAGVAQGSGVGDNAFEVDGAEANDAIPMTCATIYNFTVIGVPDGLGGPLTTAADHGIAFRDSARLQVRQTIFMDLGERLITEESSEGSATNGWRYGNNGTLSWAAVWSTPFTETWNTSNVLTGGHPNMKNAAGTQLSTSAIQAMFRAQSQGNNVGANNQGYLCELTDSVFYNNTNSAAYTVSNGVGPDVAGGKTVTVGGGSSPALGNVVATNMPIKALGRGPVVNVTGQLHFANVISLDPRAANNATTSVATAPLDGFFTPVRYRGAFSPNVNWLLGWTASSAYGFHAGQTNPAEPTVNLALHMTTTSFQTTAGVSYSVESSVDGRNWVPFAVVQGDGTVKTVSSLVGFDPAKLYRVSVQ